MNRAIHATWSGAMRELPQAVACPCCGAQTKAPSVEIIIDNLKIVPQQAKILRALWNGNGHPVVRSRLYDAMYCDDIDGGPGHEKARLTLKVAIHKLRERLKGTGIEIETLASRNGYRLKIRSE